MSKVITFSTKFPSYHPKAGSPTYFVEKIWAGIFQMFTNDSCFDSILEFQDIQLKVIDMNILSGEHNDKGFVPKYHTIRAGRRFKAGDYFSPRIWSGKPYNSKQIIIAPDIKIENIWDIKLDEDEKRFWINGSPVFHNEKLAMNDGLSVSDLVTWFKEPFDGQIICWNKNINY